MPRTTARSKSLYSVHPSVAYARAILENLSQKTGKTLDEWLRLVERSGVRDEGARRVWLIEKHDLGNTTASMIAERSVGKGEDGTDPDAYLASAARWVDEMYAGAKAHLRPIHDALIALGRSLGDDVRICPCQTIVPMYRQHVFAQIKPSTRSRIDLGLALAAARRKPARLIETGGAAKGDRITHRIPIESVDAIDDVVHRWLAAAYDLGNAKVAG